MNFHSKLIKASSEQYSRVLLLLILVSLSLIIINILYLQNSLIVLWLNYNFTSFSNEVMLQDILFPIQDIDKNNLNIFFIETSCSFKQTKNAGFNYFSSEKITFKLNIRQACAIESTANVNFNQNIYILYTCPINENIFKQAPKEVKQIFHYKNVKIVKLDMYNYFKDSLVEDLYFNGILEKSKYPLEHTSDVLRFLTLWKYGGTYMDMDVISLRSLNELQVNYAAYETETAIGSAVLNFECSGIGFELLTNMLTHLDNHFDGEQWSNNGPYLVTNTLHRLCSNSKVQEEKTKRICSGFTIYNTYAFYPVPWHDWRLFFQVNTSSATLKALNNSYIAHLWNKHSHNTKVFVGSEQPYEKLASKFCHLTYKVVKNKHISY